MATVGSHALSHFFIPEDANLAGNVHGGTILKLVEKAGWVASARHIAANGDFEAPPACVTARLDSMSFLKPIHIGNLGHFDAKVTFTSRHSMRVEVDVYAEDLSTGRTVLANRASVWYVAMKATDGPPSARPSLPRYSVVEVPPVVPETDAERAAFEIGRTLYEQRREEERREAAEEVRSSGWESMPVCPTTELARHTVAASSTQLVQLMGASSCVNHEKDSPVSGGVVLKLMDECAGITAGKHCRTNVVTASLDAVDFMVPILRGDLVSINARPVFSSSKSLEIEVVVETESLRLGRVPALRALFTFVSLNPEGRVADMPPLVLATPTEKARFEQGLARYSARKALRAQAAKAASATPS